MAVFQRHHCVNGRWNSGSCRSCAAWSNQPGIGSYTGTLYVLRPGRLVSFDGLQVNEDCIDWGHLPSNVTHDMLCYGSRLFISTDRGLGVLRGAALSTIKGTDGLRVENATCLAKGFANDIWIGTTVRMLPNDCHYFAGQMWLPGNHVNGIAVGDRIVYVATDKGIGIIKYEPYTLEKKVCLISLWNYR